MNLIYRKARIDDYKDIYYVSCYSWEETYRGFIPDDYLDDRINNFDERSLKTKKYLEKLDSMGDLDKYLVCEVNGKIIGICQYMKSQNDNYRNSGLLGALYVLKKYQGLGIGKELFKIAILGLKDMGYNSIYLECLTGNKSLDFYKKYGGEVLENIDYPISDFTVKADIVFYNDLDCVLELLK